MWEVTLRLPSWLLAFFGISRGLYLCLKLRIHTYFITEERNWLILQSSFFRQALGRLDPAENGVEAGQLVIIHFWPNLAHREQQGIIHIPVEVRLDTTTPNTPNNEQDSPPDYCNLSPPPPHLGRYHEAYARNTTPSESSDGTEVSGASQNSSEIQWEVDTAIQRAQSSMNLDQHAFNGLTYWDLQQIDLVHHCQNPHLYTFEAGVAASSSSQQFPRAISQAEEEEVEEQEEETPLRTEFPLPIQVEWRDQIMQNKQGETPSSLELSGNSADSGTREVLWMPSHNTIPTREE